MDALLRFPGTAQIVIDIRDVEARLVTHRELPHHTGCIGKDREELELRHPQRDAEKRVQFLLRFRATAHQLKQALQIMLDVPLEGVGIILCEIGAVHIARVHTLNPIALFVPGPEHAFVGTIYVTVPGGPIQEEQLVIGFAQFARKLRHSPVTISKSRGQPHGLAPLPRKGHLRDGLFLSRMQGRIPAMLVIELVQNAAGTVLPWQQRLLQGVVPHAFKTCLKVELKALGTGIRHPDGGIVAGHRRPVT